ncbi:DksA protein [Enterovibrio paralichthyis]|uniref:DksA protein n=1 Tax=Enterovibrio paralichthyis TaxID=2853805 RepID=UPI001C480EE8|nr:DksA protein [Enterovibrio paralichthyis]MBV7299581.1 DksA protein [Enterovibrio paralichthyis]
MIDIKIVAQLQQSLEKEKDVVRSRVEDKLICLTGSDITSVPTAYLIKLCRTETSKDLLAEGVRLEKIDAALCAIETELFGLCADCEEEIELDDLSEDPAEPRCRGCRDKSHYKHARQ